MGYWGIAMSHISSRLAAPLGGRSEGGPGRGGEGQSGGGKDRARARLRRGDRGLHKDSDKVPHRERALAWSSAMQQLSARYPEDHEAAIFYALSLLGTAPAFDKTYASQKHAAAILNRHC